jgi:hypothetical protein
MHVDQCVYIYVYTRIRVYETAWRIQTRQQMTRRNMRLLALRIVAVAITFVIWARCTMLTVSENFENPN